MLKSLWEWLKCFICQKLEVTELCAYTSWHMVMWNMSFCRRFHFSCNSLVCWVEWSRDRWRQLSVWRHTEDVMKYADSRWWSVIVNHSNPRPSFLVWELHYRYSNISAFACSVHKQRYHQFVITGRNTFSCCKWKLSFGSLKLWPRWRLTGFNFA